MKVRQNASSATTTSAPKSTALRQEIKIDEAKTEAEVDIREEEGEDSGMEREDMVSNNELSDLKKVRFSRRIIRSINSHRVEACLFNDKSSIN